MAATFADRWGVPVLASRQEGVALFNRAVGDLVALSGEPGRDAEAAGEVDHFLVLGHVLQAYLALYETSPDGRRRAQELLRDLDHVSDQAPRREVLHLRAAGSWAAGDWRLAAGALEQALLLHPRDLLALKVAQDLYFFLGDHQNLRDVAARVQDAWVPTDPGWGYVQGIYAFGLEENADYRRAEARARAAIEADPRDVWATHALAHVHEMEGAPREGVAFLTVSAEHWTTSYFAVHNWWHRALFHLDLGEIDQALAIYDGPMQSGRAASVHDLADGASLLWRLWLLGGDVSTRAKELASEMERHVGDPVYVFNDWHAVMAFGIAGRHDAVAHLIQRNQEEAVGTNAAAVRAAGQRLLEGFAALAEGLAGQAVDRLRDVRSVAHVVGGSNAQRDVIDVTLLAAATRSGNGALVRALAAERVARRPTTAAAVERLVEANQLQTD